MPGKKVWIWLTGPQVKAVLAVAEVVDRKLESLATILPQASDRMAFRRAITVLQNVRTGTNEANQ